MDNNYTVYLHLNKINGKRYYGITSMKPKNRWRNGKGYYGNKHFTDAINLYGWENFEHIIVAKGLTKEEAGWIETVLIAEYDTTNPDKGYNNSLGGESWNCSEETKQKMSEAKIGKKRPEISGENNPMYGRCGENHPMYGKNSLDYMTEEAKKERGRKLSEANKGENNPMYGKKRPEHSERISGKNHPQAKSVIAIINDKIFGAFDYAKQGEEYFGCNQSNIIKCCKGKYKSCGKYNGCKIVWKYLDIIEL